MILQNHKAEKKRQRRCTNLNDERANALEATHVRTCEGPGRCYWQTASSSPGRPALVGVKAVHSLIYFSIESCMGYLLYTGLKGREDRRTGIAAGVVAAESLIFVGNGRRCPLTGLAETLGEPRAVR